MARNEFTLRGTALIQDVVVASQARAKLRNLKVTIDNTQARKSLEQLGKTADQLKTKVDSATKSMLAGSTVAKRFGKVAGTQLKAVSKEAQRGSRFIDNFSNTFVNVIERAAAFRIATIGINSFVNAISDAATFLREFEQILTDIQKVLDTNEAQVKRFGTALIDTAARFGFAVEDVASQFKTIVQAGFQGEQALNIVSLAAKGAAATTLEFAEATDLLIQIARQFGEQELDTIFDKIAAAESVAAVTAQDLQEALRRSAAALIAVNTSVEDAVGLISALQETTRRGGAVVGTALRTLSTRVFAGRPREAVESLGVAVENADGTLRSFSSVLIDLKAKFESLTESQSIQAAKLIAGRRQFENFLVLVQKSGRAQEIAAKAADSQGEATRRAALQAQTLNAQLNRLRDNALKAVRGFNEIVPIFDAFKIGVKAVNSLLESFDGLAGKILLVASAFGALKGLGGFLKQGLGAGLAGAGAGATFGSLAFGGPAARQGAGRITRGAAGGLDKLFNLSGIAAASKTATKGLGRLTKGFSRFGAIAGQIAKGPLARIAIALGSLAAFDFAGKALADTFGVNKDAANQLTSTLGTFASTLALTRSPLAALGATLIKVGIDSFNAFKAFERGRQAFIKAAQEGASPEEARARRGAAVARSLGDVETARLADQAADFSATFRKLNTSISKTIFQSTQRIFEESVPGTIPSAEKVKATIQDELIRTFSITPEVAQQLLQSQSFIQKFTSALGQPADSLDDLIKQIQDLTVSLDAIPEDFDLSKRFDLSDLLQTLQEVDKATRDAATAQRIFAENITDPLELARLEARDQLRELNNIRNAAFQRLSEFRKSIPDVTSQTFQEVVDIVQKELTSAERRGITVSGPEFTSRLESRLEEVGSAARPFIINLTELTDIVKDTTIATANRAKTEAELNQQLRLKEIDQQITKLQQLRDSRFAEIDAITGLQEELSDFIGEIPSARDELLALSNEFVNIGDKISAGISPESFLELARSVEPATNQVDKAEMAFREIGRTLTQQLGFIQERINVLKAENTALGNTNKEVEVRERNLEEIKRLEESSAQAILEARQKASDAARRVIEARTRAEEKLFDAQEKVRLSIAKLSEQFETAATKAEATAQKQLKDAQKEVINATRELSTAYEGELNARAALRDAIADFRIGVLSAARETAIIRGDISGLAGRLQSIRDIFSQVINEAFVTERKRLELLKESASQQLSLIQQVVDETKSIGQRLFTAGPELGNELTRGFAAIRDILSQVQRAGGPEAVDLNEFGNQLLALPQALREEISQALSFLPETATLGGFSKDEIERLLFGAAVGESQEANIADIRELTSQQVDLITEIADLNREGVTSAQAQLFQSEKQVEQAQEQLELAKINLERAEQNVEIVREQIRQAATEISLAQSEASALLSSDLSTVDASVIEQTQQMAIQHGERLAQLRDININTANLTNSLQSLASAVSSIGTAAHGHIPRNFAGGNLSEVSALIAAYRREKAMAPAGSKPVIANDSEVIIPTKFRGNIPNFQGGNITVGTDKLERLLSGVLEELQSVSTNTSTLASNAERSVAANVPGNMEATINVNAQETVRVTGAASIAEAFGSVLREQLSGFVTNDTISNLQGTLMQMFEVLRERGLVSSFGQS